MSKRPTPEKSVRKSVKRAKLADGRVAPGRGPGNGAPNAGRTPDEWRKALRALGDRSEVLAHIEAALLKGPPRFEPDPTDPTKMLAKGTTFFERALDYVTDHGYGKAASSVDVTTAGKALSGIVILPSVD